MKILAALKVLLSLRAWRKSRTLKAAAGGVAGGAAIMLDPNLVQLVTAAFNFISPIDLSTGQMSGFLVFAISVGAALLRADTHDSLSTEGDPMTKRLFVFPVLLAIGAAVALAGSMLLHSSSADAQPRGSLIYSKTYDAGSLIDAAGETTAVTAPGAVLGDFCVASLGVDVVDMTVTCNVVSDGSAEVRVQNESGTTHDLASTTLRVIVFPHGTR